MESPSSPRTPPQQVPLQKPAAATAAPVAPAPVHVAPAHAAARGATAPAQPASPSAAARTAAPARSEDPLAALLEGVAELPWTGPGAELAAPRVAAAAGALGLATAPPPLAPDAAPFSKKGALLHLLALAPPREHAARLLSLLARRLPAGDTVELPPCFPPTLHGGGGALCAKAVVKLALRLDDSDEEGLLFLSENTKDSEVVAFPNGATISKGELWQEFFIQKVCGIGKRRWRLEDTPPRYPWPSNAVSGSIGGVVVGVGGEGGGAPLPDAPPPDVAALILQGLLPADYQQRIDDNRAGAVKAKTSELHFAAMGGNEPVLLALLADGADPAALDGAKDTPLHVAARAGKLGAVQLLLKRGAPWHAVNAKGETFADAAAAGDVAAYVAQLLKEVRVGHPSEAPEREWTKLRFEVKKTLPKLPALDKIMALTGIRIVKRTALNLAYGLLADAQREPAAQVFKDDVYNFALIGNPGTGKTTVAEHFGDLLIELGVRTPSAAAAAPAPPLAVAGAAGAAAPAPNGPFQKHFGYKLKKDGADKFEKLLEPNTQVLLIDEVYQLDPAGNSEGRAITDKLLDVTETKRKELSVFVAGYKEDVQKWMDFNAGLSSRFREPLLFEDFDEPQLRKLFEHYVREKRWFLAPLLGARAGITTSVVIARRLARGAGRKGFANARTVRQVVDTALRRANERIATIQPPASGRDLVTLLPQDVLGPCADPGASPAIKELNARLGLASVKAAVSGLAELVRCNHAAELCGDPVSELSLHRLFLGNPGTGKTETAVIYGRVLKELGLLSSGELVEKKASQLEGAAEGKTKEGVNKLFDSIRGKVLLIDEAYQLKDTDYGKHAIDVIVERAQGVPGEDFAVLLAGA